MTSAREQTLQAVRRAVRSVIEATPELRRDPALSRAVAERMVGVSLAAAELIQEEQKLSEQIGARGRRAHPALSQAQAAGDHHRRTAVNSAAGTLRATRDAIDFPGFVTSLITGVFQSIQTSSIQQLQAFADLLEAVSSSTSDFAASQISAERAAAWATSRFPALGASGSGEELVLTLRDDAELPDSEELARALGASEEEVSTIDDSELTETLLPLVRRKLARDRQAMLSTMVLMGLQRVVVDDGAIHASMQLQVDARSSAEQRTAEQSDLRVEAEAAGSFGMGLWGASAKLSTSVGYVKSDEQLTKEDIAVSAGLRSSVDVRFRTVPLDMRRMASDRTLDQLRERSLVPETERALSPGSLLSQQTPETKQPSLPTPHAPGSLLKRQGGDTLSEAVNAREKAAAEKKAQEEKKKAEEARRASAANEPAGGKGDAKPKPQDGKAGEGARPAAGKPGAKEAPAVEAKPKNDSASATKPDAAAKKPEQADNAANAKPPADAPQATNHSDAGASKAGAGSTIGGVRRRIGAAFATRGVRAAGPWGAPLPEPERNRPT